MKYLFLLIIVIPFSTAAQKPVIDSTAINRADIAILLF